MITANQVDDFAREVRKWRTLSTEEQENVISKALELFHTKGSAAEIREPVRWLLRAAKWIRREELRHRKQYRERFAELCECLIPDRRRNGKPVGRETATESIESLHVNRSETSHSRACRQALESLTVKERQVVELCDIAGFMPAEAGRILSMGRSTTKSHLTRAHKKLLSNRPLYEVVERKGRRAHELQR